MLRSKKGMTFFSVVGICVVLVLLGTMSITMVLNSSNLVTKYSNNKQSYNSVSDSLNQAAQYLVDKSAGESLEKATIAAFVNETLDLDSIFDIDLVDTTNDISEVNDDLTGLHGKQVTLRKSNLYINVFLSDDGSQKSLSNIFFDNSASLDFAYKTGFLTASYIYENGLYYYPTSSSPVKNKLYNSDGTKSSGPVYDQAVISNDTIYQTLLPKKYEDNPSVFELDADGNFKYKESFIDNQLIDQSIAKCLPASNKFTKAWNGTSTFSSNTVTFIKGDVTASAKSVYEFVLQDNCTVYIQGDFNMNFSRKETSGSNVIYYPTLVKLGKNSSLIVGGNITITNSYMTPKLESGDRSNIVCAGNFSMTGTQRDDLTIGSNSLYSTYSRLGGFAKFLLSMFGVDQNYINSLAENIKGTLEGTIISGNNVVVDIKKGTTTDIPPLPIRATIYADDTIDFNATPVSFKGVSFLFSRIVKFISTDTNVDVLIDAFSRYDSTEYLFIIIDDGIEYRGKTTDLKANIFTTNQNNTDSVVTSIGDVYEASGQSGNRIINSIFKWIGLNSDIQKVEKNEVDVDVSNLGLPKVLTEGSADKSYHSNVGQKTN